MTDRWEGEELDLPSIDYFLIDKVKEILNQGIDNHVKANLLCDLVKDEVDCMLWQPIRQRYDEAYETGREEGYEEGYDDGQDEFNEESYQDGCSEGFRQGVVEGIERVLNETDLNLTSEQTEGIEYLLFKTKRER
ncbi:hypothetical protein [Turicibacter sanguinis]|uniref:hypothetical protein n=1 Tax=Turicibacter sanguinis TaxID=154288 RepID=UPI0012BC650F|nr:hypothetical protein [Turicibacter sanguinis]MDB8436757.1 hypothetical protein [Turicibacter sanguinis]MTO25298.1 hypothetical protein [Turicibacter sanguinis]MTO91130.1 hypothetical protein [Turicibacter sanguinis]MTQ02944.1 hypothetical protein [Turicibacter sanguinis]MTQ36332.1 hypothetical protein [Turicibacter sanguinis]